MNNIEIVEMHLDRGVNIRVRNTYGCNVLHNAIQREKMEITEFLLDRGADVNTRDNGGITPLHVASMKRCSKVVEKLKTVKFMLILQVTTSDERQKKFS